MKRIVGVSMKLNCEKWAQVFLVLCATTTVGLVSPDSRLGTDLHHTAQL